MTASASLTNTITAATTTTTTTTTASKRTSSATTPMRLDATMRQPPLPPPRDATMRSQLRQRPRQRQRACLATPALARPRPQMGPLLAARHASACLSGLLAVVASRVCGPPQALQCRDSLSQAGELEADGSLGGEVPAFAAGSASPTVARDHDNNKASTTANVIATTPT
jgi:hypothetical protein